MKVVRLVLQAVVTGFCREERILTSACSPRSESDACRDLVSNKGRLMRLDTHMYWLLGLISMGSSLLFASADVLSANPSAETSHFGAVNDAAEAAYPFTVAGGHSGSQLPAVYRAAVKRFPNVAACLSVSEGDPPQDVGDLDWSRTASREDIDVCIFRILTSLHDVNKGIAWFRRQGFQIEAFHPDASSETSFRKQGQVYQSYAATISTKKLYEKTSWSKLSATFHLAPVASVQVLTTSTGAPLSTKCTFNLE
ncbi:hypothetical protein HF205_20760 [Rhizobium leguminosarum]|nr:hypothetical protein [Rhizobium leguminosarum]